MSDLCLHCEVNVALGEQEAAPAQARYINSAGEKLCGVDDCISPWTSVRISDIPAVLRILDTLLKSNVMPYQVFVDSVEKLKELVCLKKI